MDNKPDWTLEQVTQARREKLSQKEQEAAKAAAAVEQERTAIAANVEQRLDKKARSIAWRAVIHAGGYRRIPSSSTWDA